MCAFSIDAGCSLICACTTQSVKKLSHRIGGTDVPEVAVEIKERIIVAELPNGITLSFLLLMLYQMCALLLWPPFLKLTSLCSLFCFFS